MATSGSYESIIRQESYGAWYIGVRWERVGVDIGANKSTIRATAYTRTTGNNYTINANATKSVYVKINGVTYNGSCNVSIGANTTKDLFSYTADVWHNADGSKDCHVEVGCNVAVTLSGTYYGWVYAGGTPWLDTIPRTSNATISTDWLHVNEGVTIYTNRASTEFTHTIWEDFGLGWWNLTATGVTDSWSWTPGYDYASRFPNSTQMGGRFRVATFRGDTYIGEVILGCTMYIRDGECVPYFEGTPYYEIVNDSGNTMPSGHIVKTQNRVRVISNPRGSYGSTITSTYVSFWGQKAEWGTNVLSPYPSVSGTQWVAVIATDSRGRQIRHDLSLYIDDWFTPWTSIDSVFRCREDGTEDAQNGTNIKIHYRASAPTIGNVWTWHNVYAYYREKGIYSNPNEGWIEFDHMSNATSYDRYPFFRADTDKSYEIRLQIVVNNTWYTSQSSIGTAFVTMSIRPEGKGVAFGKVAETDWQLDCAIDFHTSKNIIFESNERRIEYWGADTNCYAFWNNTNRGYWDDIHGQVWNFSGGTLYLRPGYQSGSDIRFKHDLVYMNNPLNRMLALDSKSQTTDYDLLHSKLKPCVFKMNDDKEEKIHIGFKAQDVLESLKEVGLNNTALVTESDWRLEAPKYDEEGNLLELEITDKRLGLAYQEIIALNTYKIQRQQAQIESQQSIINKQQKEIDNIKVQLEELKSIINK